jgi:hypothetical protein
MRKFRETTGLEYWFYKNFPVETHSGHAECHLVGNSSALIRKARSSGRRQNIGSRGWRERGLNIIDVGHDCSAIVGDRSQPKHDGMRPHTCGDGQVASG